MSPGFCGDDCECTSTIIVCIAKIKRLFTKKNIFKLKKLLWIRQIKYSLEIHWKRHSIVRWIDLLFSNKFVAFAIVFTIEAIWSMNRVEEEILKRLETKKEYWNFVNNWNFVKYWNWTKKLTNETFVRNKC